MPIIPLDLDQSLPQKEFYALMYAQVVAVMAYPNSSDERKKAVLAFASNRLAGRSDLPIIRENANPDFSFSFNKAIQKGGQTAGQVLNWIVGLHNNPDFKEKMSVGLAVHIVAQERHMHMVDTGGEETDQAPCAETIEEAWKKFKSVAHFWAQLNILNIYKGKSCKTIPDFLMAAEARRMWGEKVRGHRAPHPVLDPETTRKLPNPLPLWHDDASPSLHLDVPLIDSKHKEIIAAYKLRSH